MFLFKKKTSISDSGILNGAIDWHSHILPGVDDGVKSIDEALNILAIYEQLGVKAVWLTPHIMEDMPNKTADLRARYRELCDAYSGPISLHLAAENMVDNLLTERLRDNDLLPLGKDGKHLLIETSYYSAPQGFDNTIQTIMSKGYYPVLAHPERYIYMDVDDYRRYIDMGVILQLNLFSLIGSYGKKAQKKARMLLKLQHERKAALPPPLTEGESPTTPIGGAYTLFGTDLHSLKQLNNSLNLEELNYSLIKVLNK